MQERKNGHKLPWYGGKRSDHSEKMMGENNPFYGKKHSEETKNKIRDINKGKKYSKEVNKKKSSSGKKNPMYGRTVMDIWIEKYGIDEATRRKEATNKKRIETCRIKRDNRIANE